MIYLYSGLSLWVLIAVSVVFFRFLRTRQIEAQELYVEQLEEACQAHPFADYVERLARERLRLQRMRLSFWELLCGIRPRPRVSGEQAKARLDELELELQVAELVNQYVFRRKLRRIHRAFADIERFRERIHRDDEQRRAVAR